MKTKSTSLSVVQNEDIKGKIYTIRNVQVMFDADLAELYGVSTKRLNEQIKRNKKDFLTIICFN